MPKWEVRCKEYVDTVEAEKSFVDSHSGTLRFYDKRGGDAVAQYAPGVWEFYKKVKDVSEV